MLKTNTEKVFLNYTTGLSFCPTQKNKAKLVAGKYKKPSGGVLNGADA